MTNNLLYIFNDYFFLIYNNCNDFISTKTCLSFKDDQTMLKKVVNRNLLTF